MKRLILILFICLAGCEDDYRNTFDSENDSRSDSDFVPGDKPIQGETKAEAEAEAETDKTPVEPKTKNTDPQLSQLDTSESETDTESGSGTDTETDTETNTETNTDESCELVIDLILECIGSGPRYQKMDDSCEYGMTSWSQCLLHCLYVSDCPEFLDCEERC